MYSVLVYHPFKCSQSLPRLPESGVAVASIFISLSEGRSTLGSGDSGKLSFALQTTL